MKYESELRHLYHSLNTEERHQAIAELAEQKTSDTNRELIHVFNECGWRETKFQILKNISKNPDIRCLEFLFDQAMQTTDLPLAQAALEALSETQNVLAARFLVEYYLHGQESLKPSCVLALGQLGDRKLIKQFIQDIDELQKNKQVLLLKNILLTLGEIKAFEAKECFIQAAQNKTFRDVSLSALVSLGKISKNTTDFINLESFYKNDSFEYQIYLNAKAQTQFRSEWSLEDYIQKILQNKKFHTALYLEFNYYNDTDLMSAFDLLKAEGYVTAVYKILAQLNRKNLPSFYEKYFPSDKAEVSGFVESLCSHKMNELYVWLSEYVEKNKKQIVELEFSELLLFQCYLLNCTSSEQLIEKYFSENFIKYSEELQIQFINKTYEFLLCTKPHQKKYNTCLKSLEHFFQNNFKNLAKSVQGRGIRFFAQLQFESIKLQTLFLQNYLDKDVKSSVQMFFSTQGQDYFFKEFKYFNELNAEDFKSVLRICLFKNQDPWSHKSFCDIFQKMLTTTDSSLIVLMLKVLTRFKNVNFKNFILSQLTAKDTVVQFHVILALKTLNDEATADDLALFLKGSSKSLAGRALDALLNLSGNRAKRLVFEFLQLNYLEIGVVDKILRGFKFPDNDTDYFVKVLQKIIVQVEKENSSFKLIPELQEFHDELVSHQKSFKQNRKNPTEADLLAIDLEFEKIIPAYKSFDEMSKAALRAAEIPFKHPEQYDHFVDKSSIVLGYAKAIDILLEKQLGRKLLFPKLETKINEFQNMVHALGLNEDYPASEKVLKNLQLESSFTAQSYPLHKTSLISQAILNGKILSEHFKVLDGLRAWAIILLLFARKHQGASKPLLAVSEDQQLCVQVAKKLIWLQDVRNPIAHRHTLLEFKDLHQVRSEVLLLLKLLTQFLF